MSYLERKIYRIIYNMSRFRKNPTIDDLKRETGKDEKTVRQAIENLLPTGNNLVDKVRPQFVPNQKKLNKYSLSKKQKTLATQGFQR
ncbi:hypothetical protein QRD88_05920 [Bacillus safensis]|uniref:hypothetical protein n=2 Tax=Bacillus safensis TaxID=561879 RepID=UPI00215174E1|nr:hypothetical protein [Bacillus safensis]MCR6472701.1 hypothetical protein [Bacillus safensis]WJE40335.1 hypothetical protein QRD88_05920 [Bacillus safensis]